MKTLGLVLALCLVWTIDLSGQSMDYDSLYLVRNCIVLDAKESVQEEREDLVYNWNFGDGSVGYGEVVEHCYDSLGTFNVVLSIMDPSVASMIPDEWEFDMIISEDYLLSFELKESKAQTIELTSDISFQSAPSEVSFFWDFGDGQYEMGEKAIHRYDSAGQYNIRLLAKIMNDDERISLSYTETIEIN